MNCNNIQLRKGSKNSNVKELQTRLRELGYYTGIVDGDYGNMTEEAVKKFQKKQGLAVDGWVGPVTCKKLQSQQATGDQTGTYKSSPHWVSPGCNKLGQCTSYYCGVHALRQVLCKFGIDKYTEAQLAAWAGTTTNGTSHQGIETALWNVNNLEGTNITVKWMNLSDLGNTLKDKMRGLGRLMERANTAVIIHLLYLDKYGHYEVPRVVNLSQMTSVMLNSLGNKCGGTAFCGYLETRNLSTLERNIRGISQKSIAVFTKT